MLCTIYPQIELPFCFVFKLYPTMFGALVLDLCSEINPGEFGEPSRVPGIEHGLATCKASALLEPPAL